jgi:hypothetical protein
MEPSTEIQRVAIVGTGVIGASWSACFLAHGLDVVATDPGLRWGLMGPNLLNHLGGGPGGVRHFLEQFAGPLTAWWADLGSPNIARPELQKRIVDGVVEEVAGRSFEALSEKRDALLIDLLELRARHE